MGISCSGIQYSNATREYTVCVAINQGLPYPRQHQPRNCTNILVLDHVPHREVIYPFSQSNYRLYVSMLDLAQLFSLIYKTIRRNFNPTPRELIEWTAPLTFDYASYYNYALFYFTIAMSYATIAPLVSPFALLYFTVSYGVHKYDMMYVYFTRNETGGSMWRVHSSRLLVNHRSSSTDFCLLQDSRMRLSSLSYPSTMIGNMLSLSYPCYPS